MLLRGRVVTGVLAGTLNAAAVQAAVEAGATTLDAIDALVDQLEDDDDAAADQAALVEFIQGGGGTTIIVNQTIEGSLVTESEVAENAVAAVEAALAEGDLDLGPVPASEGPGGFSQ